MKKIIALPFLLFLITCGNPQPVEVSQPVVQKRDSVVIVKAESGAFDVKDIAISNINQFIHPEKGLWLIQSAGAMPSMMHTTQVDKNFPIDFSKCIEDILPKVDCNSKTLWTKEGCFIEQVNTFVDEKLWSYCNLSKEDDVKVTELAKTVSYTVINTSFYARYYFAQIEGKWYLVFADLRVPCSA